MVGILVSFWDGLFSGAMLVLGSVQIESSNHWQKPPQDFVFIKKSSSDFPADFFFVKARYFTECCRDMQGWNEEFLDLLNMMLQKEKTSHINHFLILCLRFERLFQEF